MSPIPELLADLAAGRMVVLVDDTARDSRGNLMLAADHVSADAVNFMALHARGLVCLTLTRERCEQLQLPPMALRPGQAQGHAFTVSIEATEGVSTGISAADRARTVQAAVARDAKASDLVQPGHVFPLQAQDGGVLMRAGTAEAGCDLARLAGCTPAAVVCEIMNDEGAMARLPELQAFAEAQGLRIGTTADLIAFRSHDESLIERLGERPLQTAQGLFRCVSYRDRNGGLHLALTHGQWGEGQTVPVRVHEPFTAMDLLERPGQAAGGRHSWALPEALANLAAGDCGVAVLLNVTPAPERLLGQMLGESPDPSTQRDRQADLRTYGVGAQILRDLGVRRMELLGRPRRMPSMAGYGLEVTGFRPMPA